MQNPHFAGKSPQGGAGGKGGAAPAPPLQDVLIPIPRSTEALVLKLMRSQAAQLHPGLILDKFPRNLPGEDIYPNQSAPANHKKKYAEYQREALEMVCKARGQEAEFAPAARRYQAALTQLLNHPGGVEFTAVTSGPLTLHLARASALENAGLCLHPILGFVYLPGSGLKGMARAYAQTVWLKAQADESAALEKIHAVFGNEPAECKMDKQKAGAVVFHDAWPLNVPELYLDLLASHHTKYYQGRGNENPPADLENPNLVSFLAIRAGARFRFVLSRRNVDVGEELAALAREWLMGALDVLGAGAKTNAGYGAFALAPAAACAADEPLHHREETLRLITPAFISGNMQYDKRDCELRGASIRGLLRWWWRTLHSAHMDIETLRKLEAAVWGDVNHGGPVRIALEKNASAGREPVQYDKAKIVKDHHLLPPPNNKTTQGLTYVSFGMDEKKGRRIFLAPHSEWTLHITARSGIYRSDPKDKQGIRIEPDDLLDQARAALALLCRFGGVGSKGRKGFGSLACLDPERSTGEALQSLRKEAAQFRGKYQVGGRLNPSAQSPSIDAILEPLEIQTFWKNIWFALDQVGYAIQQFSQSKKHNPEKKGLGLPRTVDGNLGEFKLQLVGKVDRYASPVHVHLDGKPEGYCVRIIAFPTDHLNGLEKNRELLMKFLECVKAQVQQRSQSNPGPDSAAFERVEKSQAQKAAISLLPATPAKEFKKRYPPKNYGVGKDGQNPTLLEALRAFGKDHPEEFAQVRQFYLDECYNKESRKKYKDKPLVKFLMQDPGKDAAKGS